MLPLFYTRPTAFAPVYFQQWQHGPVIPSTSHMMMPVPVAHHIVPQRQQQVVNIPRVEEAYSDYSSDDDCDSLLDCAFVEDVVDSGVESDCEPADNCILPSLDSIPSSGSTESSNSSSSSGVVVEEDPQLEPCGRFDLDELTRKNGGPEHMTNDWYKTTMQEMRKISNRLERNTTLKKAFYERTAFLGTEVIDFHYLDTDMALGLLNERIVKINTPKSIYSNVLYAVTGCGNGSSNKKANIREAFETFAVKNSIGCERMSGNDGVLILTISSSRK